MLADLQREARTPTVPVSRRTTGELVTTWLEDRRQAVSRSTWVRYEELIRLRLATVSQTPISLLSPDDIRAAMTGLSPTVGRGALRILKAALQVAVNDGRLQRNPAAAVTPPRKPGQAGRALTDEETSALIAVARRSALYALWIVYIDEWVRMGEGLGLRWTDVDFAGRQIEITGSIRHQPQALRKKGELRLQRVEPKTAAGRRWVPLSDRAWDALQALPRDAVYVFHRNGRPLNPSTVQRAFALMVEEAKLGKVRLHDLRHSGITRALANSASLDDVRRIAGHSSIRITADHYAHRVEAPLREAVRRASEAVG